MSLPASDNFNTGTGPISTTWTEVMGGFTVVSNQVTPSVGGNSLMFWNADAFGNDQYSQLTIAGIGNGLGPAVRVSSAGGGAGYIVYVVTTNLDLYKFVNSSATLIHSNVVTVNANDVIKLSVSGTTLTVYQNSSLVDTQTDADLSTGAAGIYGGAANGLGDDWMGDNVGTTPTVRYRLRWRRAS